VATERFFSSVSLADPSDATPSSHSKVFVTRVVQQLHKTDPREADRVSKALDDFPEAGTDFAGFHLLEELGRGAFARVFLARQGELSDRPVVLKVSMDAESETAALAQLVHTNIVPVYSVHHSELFQAVCMPWLGRTTLADILESLRGACQTPRSGSNLIGTVISHGDPLTVLPSGRERPIPEPATEDFPTFLPMPSGTATATHPSACGTRAIRDMLERISYVDAVLWLLGRLADGLAYAHERGILHRDLKPANILVTGEAQPMLLDFNLAEDTKLRRAGVYAEAGGTILYMSPEQLVAFRGMLPLHADARSDVFALGVIFYELLTLRFPFLSQGGNPLEIIDALLSEQRAGPPPLRSINPDIPPAAESIVQHCLEPDPARRYQSARDLLEDIDLHRANKPLRHAPNTSLLERLNKFRRRHPALTSSGMVSAAFGSVIVVLAVLLVGFYCYWQTNEALRESREVHASLGKVNTLVDSAVTDRHFLEEASNLARTQLDSFKVLERPTDWERNGPLSWLPARARLHTRNDLGELLFVLALGKDYETVCTILPEEETREKRREALDLVRKARLCYPNGKVPPALEYYETGLLTDLGERPPLEFISSLGWAWAGPRGTVADWAFGIRAAADPLVAHPMVTSRDHFFEGKWHALHQRYQKAIPLLGGATRLEPNHFTAWFLLGFCQARLGRHTDATWCFTVAIGLRPDDALAHYHRGRSWLERQNNVRACEDFDKVLELRPDLTDAWLSRAVARQRLGDSTGALADVEEALARKTNYTRAWFWRARLHRAAGRPAEARSDEEEGFRREPADEHDRLERGFHLLQRDPKAALADFEAVLKVNTCLPLAWQYKAYVLAEKLGRVPEAIETLDTVLKRFPDAPKATHLRVSRGVYHARCGQRDKAHADARDCQTSDDPETLYRIACIYALTSPGNLNDKKESLRWLARALEKGYTRFDVIAQDPDVAAIRDLEEFRKVVRAAWERTLNLDSLLRW
jgi:serine/threonine protein kinase